MAWLDQNNLLNSVFFLLLTESFLLWNTALVKRVPQQARPQKLQPATLSCISLTVSLCFYLMYLLINQVAVEPSSICDRQSCEAKWLSVTEYKAGFHQNKQPKLM